MVSETCLIIGSNTYRLSILQKQCLSWKSYDMRSFRVFMHLRLANVSGNIQSQSYQLVEPLWTDPGIKSGNSVRELISTVKKTQAGNEWSNILPKPSQARVKPPPLPPPLTTDKATLIVKCRLASFRSNAEWFIICNAKPSVKSSEVS